MKDGLRPAPTANPTPSDPVGPAPTDPVGPAPTDPGTPGHPATDTAPTAPGEGGAVAEPFGPAPTGPDTTPATSAPAPTATEPGGDGLPATDAAPAAPGQSDTPTEPFGPAPTGPDTTPATSAPAPTATEPGGDGLPATDAAPAATGQSDTPTEPVAPAPTGPDTTPTTDAPGTPGHPATDAAPTAPGEGGAVAEPFGPAPADPGAPGHPATDAAPAAPGEGGGALGAMGRAGADEAAVPSGSDVVVDEDEDEDVPWSEEDDDRTDETLAWLRRKRRAHRRARGRELAVLVYTVLIAVAGYGSSFAVSFLRGLEDGSGYADAARDLRAAMPALFALLTVGTAVLAARDALWRGPVVVPGPAVGWLLAQPVRRGRVLRPWFRLSAGLALIPGVLAGVAGASVLRVTGLAPLGTAILAALPAALCLPLLGVALGMAVERHPGAARAVRRWTAPAVLLLAALVAQTVLATNGHRSPAVEQVELWSGPWGWAGQPVVDAIGGTAPAWPAAVALLAAATAAALAVAYRDAALVPTARLRERAATATTVSSVAWSLELRAAKLAIMDAGGGTPVRQVRLRPPRGRYGRHLVVTWRDLLTLLRTPGRLGKAALWTAAGAAVAGLGADLGGERRWVGLVIGLLLGYLAVGALAEPARLETDDIRRAAWAPYRFRTLMLHHGVVPALLGALLGLLAAVPYALSGHTWTLLLLPLCAPPFTAAALVSASRGPARTQLLFLGGGSPVGGPGPFLYVAWYAAGPLVALTTLTLALAPVLRHGGTGSSVAQAACVCVLLTGLLLLLTTRMADRLVRH
ncbi:hypothetical protein [Streptomyces sp. NPDC049040]|uniref:hypothetical protein n=1 Tax=Streptomyces sp. NPDC049040 TaxID=3365593 RepID=UPI00371E6A47